MRITGGRAGGAALRAERGGAARPATDRLREAVFSSLGDRVAEARVCDLFAGSGAYGLEALSRGAAEAVFVERRRSAVATIRENLAGVAKSLGEPMPPAHVVQGDAIAFRAEEPFDLVFADPPYERLEALLPKLGPALAALCAEEGAVVFEVPGHLEPRLAGLSLERRIGKGRGQPTACLYRRK